MVAIRGPDMPRFPNARARLRLLFEASTPPRWSIDLRTNASTTCALHIWPGSRVERESLELHFLRILHAIKCPVSAPLLLYQSIHLSFLCKPFHFHRAYIIGLLSGQVLRGYRWIKKKIRVSSSSSVCRLSSSRLTGEICKTTRF